MPSKIALTSLNARTIDILNTIRANASPEYQSLVPEITQATQIPTVGQILEGYPALANQFVGALMNRIAIVETKSMLFNNAFAILKKGFIEFGETVEEVFVELVKARCYNPEKSYATELKRTLPDIRSAFHAINWKVRYPVTIEREELFRAFLSINGVNDLIAKIVNNLYASNEYDEFLLTKYMIIKAVSHGQMKPIEFDASVAKNGAKAFRGYSNEITFPKTQYNEKGVLNSTPRDRQVIIMDSHYNAEFDVEVLAAAFHMEKAEFMGRLILVDDFTTFNNERFEQIREESTSLEEVTDAELALMTDVKAVLCDEDWFQMYDNLAQFTEVFVSSGLYWNYNYHVWKTISHSPFANALVFVDDNASTSIADSYEFVVSDKSVSALGTILTLEPNVSAGLAPTSFSFVQTEDCTEDGIAIHRYGAVIYPPDKSSATLQFMLDGTLYESCTITAGTPPTYATATVAKSADVGDKVYFCKKSLLA